MCTLSVRMDDKVIDRVKELEGDPEALFKMSGILGKPQAGFSWDKLREEAIYDKYKV